MEKEMGVQMKSEMKIGSNESEMETLSQESEMEKLAMGLRERGIEFEYRDLLGCKQILVGDEWDAVCHRYSIGGDNGLIEVMGNIVDSERFGDSVQGNLRAEDVLKMVDEKMVDERGAKDIF